MPTNAWYYELSKENHRQQELAKSNSKKIFNKITIHAWPACVDCGQGLRDRSGTSRTVRDCGCPFREWRIYGDDWVPRSLSKEG